LSQSIPIISTQPIYVKLQALQEGSVTFWQAIPQSFQDHVGTINVSLLAVLVSSNMQNIALYKDFVGNLWLEAEYMLKIGDYISTLTWVSSKTINENLSLPDSVPFPESFPVDIAPFLTSGNGMPVGDTIIKELAESHATPDMIETVENILSFVNGTQTYDREKVRLLMSGNLNTTSMLDFANDPLESLATNNSFCFERALLATTMLRAVHVPTRTFTNADLKTWIQVWLPNIGWVDAEVLCLQSQPLFPRPPSSAIPWMVENSSDAMFPFRWSPEIQMRVANISLSHLEAVKINEYRTVLSQAVDTATYGANPKKYSFPVVFDPEIVRVALTRNGSNLTFHLSREEKEISKTLILEETNRVEFENLGVSFKPVLQGDFIVLQDFVVQELWMFDLRILIFVIVAVPIVIVVLFFWKRKKTKA